MTKLIAFTRHPKKRADITQSAVATLQPATRLAQHTVGKAIGLRQCDGLNFSTLIVSFAIPRQRHSSDGPLIFSESIGARSGSIA